MAQLFVSDDTCRCGVLRLIGAPVRVDVQPLQPLRAGLRRRDLASGAFVLRLEGERENEWVLLAGAATHVRVNGYPLASGLRVLEHGDEIRVAGVGVTWFSTEQLAHVEPFPGTARPTHCARTKVELTKGMQAVRCPDCRTWYAETDRYPGWTYAATCVMCRHPTDLSAGFRWVPGEA